MSGGHATKWKGLVLPVLDEPACRDTDPELFFVEGDGAMSTRELGRARQVCFGCPEKMPCLRFALQRDMHGVWGGSTQAERRAHQKRVIPESTRLRAERMARLEADPTIREHGNAGTYFDWGCRCEPCCGAAREYQQAGRERRKTAAS